jgi:hypothetical protein
VDRLGGRNLELACHGVDRHIAISLVISKDAASNEIEQDERHVTFVEERDLLVTVRARVILAPQRAGHRGQVEDVFSTREPLGRWTAQPT